MDFGIGELCRAHVDNISFDIIVYKYADKYVSNEIKSENVWERYESQLLRKIVSAHKNPFIMNIGANIGWYVLLCASITRIGGGGEILAIEPDPYNFMLLTDNVRLNAFGNVECLNVAISDKNEYGSLYLSEFNFGDHRLFSENGLRQSIHVNLLKVDEILKNRNSYPDILISDTQGSEGLVFKGSEGAFAQGWSPIIFFEYCTFMAEDKGEYLVKLLKDWEYTRYEYFCIEKKEKRIRRISARELENFARETQDCIEEGPFLDLVAIPIKKFGNGFMENL